MRDVAGPMRERGSLSRCGRLVAGVLRSSLSRFLPASLLHRLLPLPLLPLPLPLPLPMPMPMPLLLSLSLLSFLVSAPVARAAEAKPPKASEYVPCTPGLAITYAFSARPGLRVVDRVRGLGHVEGPVWVDDVETTAGASRSAPVLCSIDRTTVDDTAQKTTTESFAREMLADRVTEAGWLAHLTAFRPPLLVEPLVRGRSWQFGEVRYTVIDVGVAVEVKAGRFPDCVRIEERSTDGRHESLSVYARDVGLILAVKALHRMEASQVERRTTGPVPPRRDFPTLSPAAEKGARDKKTARTSK